MSRASFFLSLALLTLATWGCGGAPAESSKVTDLQAMQKAAPEGIIRLNMAGFNKYAAGRARPYTLIVFLTAAHLQDKPNLQLRTLRREYSYMAQSYLKELSDENKASLFFIDMEFSQAKEIFHRLGVSSLPYIFRLSPSLNIEPDGNIKVKDDDVMKPENYPNYPWTAQDIADFVQEKTGIAVSKIDRPSLLQSPIFPVILIAVLGIGAYVGLQLYQAPFMKNMLIWTAGALVVFWFAVSGGLHNIIRGVPMKYFDPKSGQVQLFLNQAQSQLGAEGFIMGSFYTSVGLTIAVLTHWGPKFGSHQRVICFALIIVAAFCYSKILETYQWKTGYRPRWFL